MQSVGSLRMTIATFLFATTLIHACDWCLAPAAAQDAAEPLLARVGWGGYCKAGRWAPVRLLGEAAEQAKSGEGGRVELSMQDGDGRTARYVGDGEWRYVKIGPLRAELSLRIPPQSVPLEVEVIPSTELLAIVDDDAGPINQAELRRAGWKGESFTVARFSAEDMPDHWLSYDAVDVMLLSTRDAERIKRLSDDQVQALTTWVEMGGRLILSVGESASELLAPGGKLAPFLPGKFVGVGPLRATTGLEMFAEATERLEGLNSVELSDVRGVVHLYDGIGARRKQPLAIESAFGFGRVTFVAFDVGAPEFRSWTGRDATIARLLAGPQERDSAHSDARLSHRASQFGYEDLAGQLRATLDQFASVRVIPFSAVVGILIAYLALIGPGDFFFLKRVLRRMSWSWATFPLIAALFAGALVWIAGATRGKATRVNQVDLIDVDLDRSRVRSTTWAHIYSPNAASPRIRWTPSLDPVAVRVDDAIVSWQGLPGRGLGGLNAPRSGTLLPTAQYELQTKFRSAEHGANGPAGEASTRESADGASTHSLGTRRRRLTASLDRYPLNASSTAAFIARTTGAADPSLNIGALREAQAGMLAGTIVNPLDVPLKNATLLYGEWIYYIDEEFAPGRRVDVEEELDARNLEWRLTERRVVEARDESTPWDPTDTDNVPRLMEMLMFHDAAGGSSYTRLTHRHQPQLDLSPLLSFGRAMLVGQVDRPAGKVILQSGDGDETSPDADRRFTFCRIVVPVSAEGSDR